MKPYHLAAGYSYLVTGDFRLEPQNPPLIKELQALPLFVRIWATFQSRHSTLAKTGDYLLGHDFLYRSTVPADRLLGLSRLVNLFLGGLLIVLIGWWAYRLWGSRAALLAMTLACLEPNLVAHSSLVTTDVGVALFIVLAVYLLWEYLQRPRWWLLVFTGFIDRLGARFEIFSAAPCSDHQFDCAYRHFRARQQVRSPAVQRRIQTDRGKNMSMRQWLFP